MDRLFENEQNIIKFAEELVNDRNADLLEVKKCLTDLIDAYNRSYREQKCLIRVSDRQQEYLREVKDELLSKTLLLECQAVDLKVLNEDLEKEIAIRKKAEKELRILANTDVLTGVNNRRRFMELLKNEISRVNRTKRPLSIMMLDIDFFKKVNDNYGHAVGDIVLCHFVDVVQDCVRDIDIIGRMGGEEFVVMLPETPQEKAATAAERIRLAVAKREIVLPQEKFNISVSIGVAQFQKGESSDMLLNRADEAMYRAKENGRNRVEFC